VKARMSVAETNRFVSSQLLRSCGGSVGWPRAGRTAGRSLSGTGLMARPCVEALRPITPRFSGSALALLAPPAERDCSTTMDRTA